MRKKRAAPFSLFAFQDAITSVCGVVVLITLLLAVQLTRRSIEAELESSSDLEARAAETRKEIAKARRELETIRATASPSTVDVSFVGLSLAEAKTKLAQIEAELKSANEERERTVAEMERKRRELALEEKDRAIEAAREEKRRAEEERDAAQERAKTDFDASAVYVAFPEEPNEAPWFVDVSGSKIVATPSLSGESAREFADSVSFATWAKTRSKTKEYFVLIVRPSGAERCDEIAFLLDHYGYKTGFDLIGENRRLEFVPNASQSRSEQ